MRRTYVVKLKRSIVGQPLIEEIMLQTTIHCTTTNFRNHFSVCLFDGWRGEVTTVNVLPFVVTEIVCALAIYLKPVRGAKQTTDRLLGANLWN